MRGQETGKDVGYRVGQGDHQDTQSSLVTFVTVGYLLQYFSHNPDMVQNYTHIVLDEVHERSMDTDLLNLLIKKLLSDDKCHCKLVVMSATLQADLFSQYFTPKYAPVVDPIFVGVRRFPVRSVFLEVNSSNPPCAPHLCPRLPQCEKGALPAQADDASNPIGLHLYTERRIGKKSPNSAEGVYDDSRQYPRGPREPLRASDCWLIAPPHPLVQDIMTDFPDMRTNAGHAIARSQMKFEAGYQSRKDGINAVKAEVSPEIQCIICEGVQLLAEAGSCILVFLPGIAEISSVQDDLESVATRCRVPLQVLVLHSLVPKEQMEMVMAEATPGHCKVVLSTNMAESSITITDVKYIIDTGLHRDIVFDDRRGMPSLLCTWCAQASVKQRAGRAGRVAPGTVLHLFTRLFHDRFMPPFDTAEILRVPLEKTVLNVKMLLTRFGRATELIQQTITPPPRDRVSAAVKTLFEAGALSANHEDSDVTVRARIRHAHTANPV